MNYPSLQKLVQSIAVCNDIFIGSFSRNVCFTDKFFALKSQFFNEFFLLTTF